IPVALLRREPTRTLRPAVRRLARGRLEDRPGLGDQGKPAAAVELPAPRLGYQALAPLVLLGHPLPATASHRRGQDSQAARGRAASCTVTGRAVGLRVVGGG